MTLREMHR